MIPLPILKQSFNLAPDLDKLLSLDSRFREMRVSMKNLIALMFSTDTLEDVMGMIKGIQCMPKFSGKMFCWNTDHHMSRITQGLQFYRDHLVSVLFRDWIVH